MASGERGQNQFVAFISGYSQDCRNRRPFPHLAISHERQSMSSGTDFAFESKKRRVHESQQLVAEGDFTVEQRHDLVSIQFGFVDRLKKPQVVGLESRNLQAGDDLRFAEEVSLKEPVPAAVSFGELGAGFALLGEQLDAQRRKLCHGPLPLAGPGELEVNLDDVGQIDEGLEFRGINEVVQGDDVAQTLQSSAGREHFGVRLNRLEDLDDRLILGQQRGVFIHQKSPRAVNKGPAARRQRAGAGVEEIVSHIQGRSVAIIGRAAVLEAGAEQQFVTVHLLAAVEDRLPGNETSWTMNDA